MGKYLVVKTSIKYIFEVYYIIKFFPHIFVQESTSEACCERREDVKGSLGLELWMFSGMDVHCRF